jgi:hypothetical protein
VLVPREQVERVREAFGSRVLERRRLHPGEPVSNVA